MAPAKSKPSKRKKTLPRKDRPASARTKKQAQAIASMIDDVAPPKKERAPRKDQLLPGSMKEQLQGIANMLTPSLQGWISEGAEEESKLKAAKITLELLEFVQPKLTRVVLSEQEAGAIARGVGAELRKQIATRMLQDTPTGDDR